MKLKKGRLMEWERVYWTTCSLTQEDLEAFWDELILRADPRWEHLPVQAVRKAFRVVRTSSEPCEAGQGVIEYVALIGLVAIVIFIIVTWLFGDGGALDQLRSTIAQIAQIFP